MRRPGQARDAPFVAQAAADGGAKAKAARLTQRRQAAFGLAALTATAWFAWTWYHLLFGGSDKAARSTRSTPPLPEELRAAAGERRRRSIGSASNLLELRKLTLLEQDQVPWLAVEALVAKPHLPADGRADDAAQVFKEDFLSIEESKSRVQTSPAGAELTNPGGCNFRGPRLSSTAGRSQADALRATLDSLPNSTRGELEEHLRQTPGAQLLSLDHDLCSWDPTVFAPSIPLFSGRGDTAYDKHRSQMDLMPSAYLMHDVCVTWNIDSTKQAQRAAVFFDPSNKADTRCVPCPNPQTNYEWATNRCGMMWMHQYNAHGLRDLRDCYRDNARKIRELGQRQVPGEARHGGRETSVRAAVYYDRPTLLLQYTRNNPGHQLWDSLFSMMPFLRAQDVHGVAYFDLVATQQAPECPQGVWICAILRNMGILGGPSAQATTVPSLPGLLSCYSELIVPVQGWNHFNDHSFPEPLGWLQATLRRAFELDMPPRSDEQLADLLAATSQDAGASSTAKYRVLLYAHDTVGEAGQRRAWLDVRETIAQMRAEAPHLEPELVTDFAALSVEAQAQLFHAADLIVMPHGGQFGNVVFLRANTVAIEVTCGGYSQWALRGKMARAQRVKHVVLRPCGCEGNRDKDNFRMPLSHVRQVVQWLRDNVKPGDYGSFQVEANKHIACAAPPASVS